MIKTTRAGTSYGIGLIALFFLLLVFLPPLLKSYRFKWDVETKPLGPTTLSLDHSLPLIYGIPGNRSSALASSDKKVKLGELFGGRERLLINFWASWCSPCLDEIPSLDMLARQLQRSADPKMPQLITVSVDESTRAVFQFFKTLAFPPHFPVLHDETAALAQALGSTKFPETYLVDRNGKILHIWVGPQDWLSSSVLERLASVQ